MNPELVCKNDFSTIFLNDVPLLDVRAPVEFQKGAFPTSHNIPILNDLERQAVGTSFKNNGQDAAIELGHRLVSGDVKAERIELWKDFFRAHPNACLYCFRGGLRSKITQQWLREAGVIVPRIEGGYKALRQYMMASLDFCTQNMNFVIVAGRTGSRKTALLNRFANSVDLERLASHRGSSFGGIGLTQPSVVNFENSLSVELQKIHHKFSNQRICVLEDEGKFIGSLSLPVLLYEKMQNSRFVHLECSFEQRVQNILEDYVLSRVDQLKIQNLDHHMIFETFTNEFQSALRRISKRLGGALFAKISELMTVAFDNHKVTGETAAHQEWIAELLSSYYDRLYDHQMESKSAKMIFHGDKDSLFEFVSRM